MCWIPVYNHPRYRINPEGLVMGIRGVLLKPGNPNGKGYPRVGLQICDGGWRKYYTVHRLVLESFVGPRPNGMFARHKDGNKNNFRLSNLEWATQSTNEKDKSKHDPDYPRRLSRALAGNNNRLGGKKWLKEIY